VELGQRYGLLSSATSYVAVEERSAADKTTSQAVQRKVPIAITQGWHGRGSVFPSATPMMLAGGAPPARTVPSLTQARLQRRQVSPPAHAPEAIQAMYGAPPAQSAGDTTASRLGQLLDRDHISQRATTGDRLFDLLMTQQADGSFRLSPVLQ